MKKQLHHLIVLVLLTNPSLLTAQVERGMDSVPLKPWAAPLYWQPSEADLHSNTAHLEAASFAPRAQTVTSALVFVGMTPCRVVDTRTGLGFTGSLGPPTLAGKSSRTFPIQSSATCSIPAIAQAYSFNVTVVPPGPVGFLTMWPTGQPQPLAATLNSLQGFIVGNAAIIPAGANGSVDAFVTDPTDIVIDINGYYAPQTGIVVSQGSAAATAVSFSGDPGTGLFSSAPGTLNFSTGGANRLTIRSDGDVELSGSIRKNGSLFMLDLGGGNTAMGFQALQLAGASGNRPRNSAFGALALSSNTTGGDNTGVGSTALLAKTTGQANTAVGERALTFNSKANFNTAIGTVALETNTTGDFNTAVGFRALGSNQIGKNNTAVGSVALGSATGTGNIALGANAGTNIQGGDNNIDIGAPGASADSGVIRIGDAATTMRFFAAGIATTGVTNAVNVVIDRNGQLGTAPSSIRYKEDVHDMGDASSGLLRLRPVTFRYKQPYDDGSKPLDYGLIAEEVAQVYPDLVVKNQHGEIETIQYQKLTPMLLNELQREHQHARQQDEAIRDLDELYRKQSDQVAALQKMVEQLLSGKTSSDTSTNSQRLDREYD
jgi:hypothetical protein